MSNAEELATRVASLRAPLPLTHGIELSDADAARVSSTGHAVKNDGYAILPNLLNEEQLHTQMTMTGVFQNTTSRSLEKEAVEQDMAAYKLSTYTICSQKLVPQT